MSLPDKNSEPAQLLADIERYIESASAMLAEGKPVLLAGLDDAVDALCKRVIAMPADEGKDFVEQFEAVRDRLDQLQQQLTEAKDTTAAELNSSDARRKATKAYQKKK